MADKKYSFILEKVGNQPLMTTKILCETLGLGLAKAKGMVDKAPTTIATDIDGTKALELKKQLEAIGNTVSVPGLQIDDDPAISVTVHSSSNDTMSVDEAFDAIFGNGAAQMATPPVAAKVAKKAKSNEIAPTATEKKIDVAAANDAFDALFGK
ncbi:MAG: ribosomal protein L7/L12 [Clostridia bacterium]|nr:ribosomal protein L7/L12 [Clostridia bacterium]